MNTTSQTESPRELCGACQKPVQPGTACVAFPTYHARCIAVLVEDARD